VDVSGTILVFGRNGQVAQELAHLPQTEDFTLEFAGRDRCDLMTTDPTGLIEAVKPIGVINASAYTAVDRAESEPDAAYRLNRDAVGEMARACAAADIPFVHISTDYVFDGTKAEPYVESDLRNPLSVYGASKAAGEDAVEAAGGRWTIFRTAWVFSPFGANFIKTMRRFAAERPDMAVVADQHGRPTLASDVAALCLEAARRGINHDASLEGLFHLAGADDAVWADLAERVFEDAERRTGRRPVLERIITADYPTLARRPANSRLDSTKLRKAADWTPGRWLSLLD
jgi:dTDP-4-dehydrorhamnose reductase